MANKQFLICMTIFLVLFVMYKQTYGMYLDCQARCILRKANEHDRNTTLQTCRDECELFELLEKEDAIEGKHHQYELF